MIACGFRINCAKMYCCPLKNVNVKFIFERFWLLTIFLSYLSISQTSACMVCRKLVAGIDSNPTDTPLEIGTSLTAAREKNRMTFLLERDKRLFAGRNGQPSRQIRAAASVYVSYSLFSRHVQAVCLREEKGRKFR